MKDPPEQGISTNRKKEFTETLQPLSVLQDNLFIGQLGIAPFSLFIKKGMRELDTVVHTFWFFEDPFFLFAR